PLLPRSTLFPYTTLFRSQSGKLVFVLLSRGHLASEDVDWTALLLTAADSHLAPGNRAAPARTTEAKPDLDRASAEREARFKAKRSEEHTSELQSRSDLVC